MMNKIASGSLSEISANIDMILKQITTNVNVGKYMSMLPEFISNKNEYLNNITSVMLPALDYSKEIMENGAYKGVEAVIDKDRTAALLAKLTMADTLMILTAVEKVSLNYNTENQVDLDVITIKDANKYISENQFAKGSMLPKVEASMSFVEDSDDRKAIISSLEKANLAIKGKTGTIIKRR